MVGFGYDSHRLAINESMIIGGVQIQSDFGTMAHSDGDVLLHALTDSLLGAAGKGDIGELFPDTEEEFKNADSSYFVKEALKILESMSLEIINIDATVILEKPKLSPYKTEIRRNVAIICKLNERKVNIKAKTNEKMGFIGRGEGVAAFCICEIQSNAV